MAKILCVLYEDPVDGFPTTYPRDTIPRIESYPSGQTVPPPMTSTSFPGTSSGACPANWDYDRTSRGSATPSS